MRTFEGVFVCVVERRRRMRVEGAVDTRGFGKVMWCEAVWV